MYNLQFLKSAIIQLDELRNGDRKSYLKIFELTLAIIQNPRDGIGKPERLKGYGEHEIYSRKINEKDRLVYQIVELERLIILISCKGHYLDR